MKTKYIILSISGLLGALAFGYFSSQILSPKVTLFVGSGAFASGAVLQIRQHLSTLKVKNNVSNL
ncbi:hypothetical protein [Nostoc sp. MS1]|uniref:hypothetical protein n=1 Tax=Nostoc sp. MS1 TaxID=2764711 RepID=UPI001CC36AE2|nr:hypothetical protein [Nostoc sp. MS1]BCL40024.1 hypothetical protein NSMS1_64710 [Nostoc sp. MS1]